MCNNSTNSFYFGEIFCCFFGQFFFSSDCNFAFFFGKNLQILYIAQNWGEKPLILSVTQKHICCSEIHSKLLKANEFAPVSSLTEFARLWNLY
jgi:hypothetical protein